MDDQVLKHLLQKYTDGTCNEHEKAMVESWYNQWTPNQNTSFSEDDINNAANRVWQRVQQNIYQQPKVKRLWPRIALAASLLLGLCLGGYFIYERDTTSNNNISAKNDLAPGSNTAVLTLAGGNKIALGAGAKGKIAQQGGVAVTQQSGLLTYKNAAATADGDTLAEVNTVSTPKGGQYELVLADGSKVWLNSISSINFPVSFKGKYRKVSITGEAYFEVAHNAAKPFIVETGNQTVQVLGTHFNINAYADESALTTTLLEGKVKINVGKDAQILLPGQQAQTHKGEAIVVRQADTEEAVAWKNGYFRFRNEDISTVMRKLARWYNLELVFKGPIPEAKFTGTISKYKNISQVLSMLEYSRAAHFKLEGRRLTISK